MRRFVLSCFLALVTFSFIYAQPTAPSGLKATVDTIGYFTFVKLTWLPDTAANMKIAYYTIYKKSGSMTDQGKFMRLPTRERSNIFTDKFVTAGKTYTYYITSTDSLRRTSKNSDTVTVTLPAPPEPVTVKGLITDEQTGKPVNRARVAVIPSSGWRYFAAITDTSGRYSVRVYPGSYYLQFSAPGYTSKFYNNTDSLSKATQIVINQGDTNAVYNAALKAKAAQATYTLSGTVTDTLGKGIRARIVVISLLHRYYSPYYRFTFTDSTGKYSMNLKGGDSIIVYAHPLGQSKYIGEFYNNKLEFAEADRISIKNNLTLNFVLDTVAQVNKSSISGRVTSTGDSLNPSGRGIISSITAFKMNEQNKSRKHISTLTDSLGNYTFNNLAPGKYILLAVPEQGFLPTFYRNDSLQTLKWKDADSIVVTSNTQLAGINFKVNPVPDSGFAVIKGRIKDKTGNGISGAFVFLTDINSNIVAYTTADAQGNYSIDDVAPGKYFVGSEKFEYTGTQQSNIDLDYTTNQNKTVDLTLSPEVATGVKTASTVITDYSLSQNYPNPFNPATTIKYQIPQAGIVQLKVFNAIGQEVATLVNEFRQAGSYSVQFDGSRLASGVYLYRLTSGSFTVTHKMVLLK